MTYGSLFAGFGGIDLGLERAGLECKWQVEINVYARHVLGNHWHSVPKHDDVRTFPPPRGDWAVDLIAGGFPCQDISHAGKQAGIFGIKSSLWFEFARIIRELRPRYVLLENVPALLARDRGFEHVLGALAEVGFDAEWQVFPASAFGAPHERERVVVVAYPVRTGLEGEGLSVFVDPPPVRHVRVPRLSEPDALRAGHGIPDYVERITGLGNSVYPPMAEWVGRQILEFDRKVRESR